MYNHIILFAKLGGIYMKKSFAILSLALLLCSCNSNTSTSTSTSESMPDTTPSVSVPDTTSPDSSNISLDSTLESVEQAPNLASAIQALGNSFVINYVNTSNNDNNIIYVTGKSVFIQYDPSASELSSYTDIWLVETTKYEGAILECDYEDDAWYDTWNLSGLDTYDDVTSNVTSLDASIFSFNSESDVFYYNGSDIKEKFNMIATLNKKNDFENIVFSGVTITLSEDNSIVREIVVSGTNTSSNEITITLTFSEYTALPFGLSDDEPIEALF